MAPCLQRPKTSTVQTPTTTPSTAKSRDSPRHLTPSTAEIRLLTQKSYSCNFSFWEQPFIYCFDWPVSVVCNGLTSLVLKGSSVFEKVARQLAEDNEGAVGHTSSLLCILNTTAPELNQILTLKGRRFPCQPRQIWSHLFSFPQNLFAAAVNAEWEALYGKCEFESPQPRYCRVSRRRCRDGNVWPSISGHLSVEWKMKLWMSIFFTSCFFKIKTKPKGNIL